MSKSETAIRDVWEHAEDMARISPEVRVAVRAGIAYSNIDQKPLGGRHCTDDPSRCECKRFWSRHDGDGECWIDVRDHRELCRDKFNNLERFAYA